MSNPEPAEAGSFPTIRIGDTTFCRISDDDLLTVIERSITARRLITVVHPNVHHLNVARANDEFRTALDRFDYLVPDGIGVHLAAEFLYGSEGGFGERQNGTDFYFRFLKLADKHRWRVFFLGDRDEVLERLTQVVRRDYDGIVIAGTHNGFFPINDETIADQIRQSSADALLVGMGVPRQEIWVQRFKEKTNVSATLAVGGGISFIAGVKKRAPSWMRSAGIEWLHRMAVEPRRLWIRYILGIPSFAVYLLKLKLGSR